MVPTDCNNIVTLAYSAYSFVDGTARAPCRPSKLRTPRRGRACRARWPGRAFRSYTTPVRRSGRPGACNLAGIIRFAHVVFSRAIELVRHHRV